jgi:hypothetical protein
VASRALLRQPLAQAPKRDASRLANNHLGVLETAFDDGPELIDMRTDEFGAALDRNTECHEGRLAHAGLAGAHVHLKLVGKNREDLLRGKSLGEGVKAAERELKQD